MTKACISREFHIAVRSWLMNRWLMPYEYKDEVRSMINHAMLNFFYFYYFFFLVFSKRSQYCYIENRNYIIVTIKFHLSEHVREQIVYVIGVHVIEAHDYILFFLHTIGARVQMSEFN